MTRPLEDRSDVPVAGHARGLPVGASERVKPPASEPIGQGLAQQGQAVAAMLTPGTAQNRSSREVTPVSESASVKPDAIGWWATRMARALRPR